MNIGDGAVRIFLNTKGKNDDEVSKELVDFLHYIENTTDDAAKNSESDRIERIHKRVCKVKTSEEIGVRYMQAWEEKYYDKEEAREEGRLEGRTEGRLEKVKDLIKKKLRKQKTVEQIADELEEEVSVIAELIDEMSKE